MASLLRLFLLLGASSFSAWGAAQAAPHAGQAFLFLEHNNSVIRQGKRALPLGDVYGRVLTFRRAEGRDFVFTLDGFPGEVRTAGLPAALAPLLEDETTAALRRFFAGGRAWVYGGGPLECRPRDESYVQFKGPPTEALPVLNVWRVDHPLYVELSNHNGLGPFETVARPIVVQLAHPDAYTFFSAGVAGPGKDLQTLISSPACTRFTEAFADEAHLRRVLSATPLGAEVAGELARGEALIGLSKQAALRRLGSPAEPAGPVEAVLAADTWVWPGLPGRGDFVLHFGGGRVVWVEEPSSGP